MLVKSALRSLAAMGVMAVHVSCSNGCPDRRDSSNVPLNLSSLIKEAAGMNVGIAGFEYKFKHRIVINEAEYRGYVNEFLESIGGNLKQLKRYLKIYNTSCVSKLDSVSKEEHDNGAFLFSVLLNEENMRRLHIWTDAVVNEIMSNTIVILNAAIDKVLGLFDTVRTNNNSQRDNLQNEIKNEVKKLLNVHSKYSETHGDVPAKIVLFVDKNGTAEYTTSDILRTLLNFVFLLDTMAGNYRKSIKVVEEKINALPVLANTFIANSQYGPGSYKLHEGLDKMARVKMSLVLPDNVKDYIREFPETLEKLWDAFKRYDIKAGPASISENQ